MCFELGLGALRTVLSLKDEAHDVTTVYFEKRCLEIPRVRFKRIDRKKIQCYENGLLVVVQRH